LPKPEPGNETIYLVCTSSGEVGVNISADHLVCDLSTFESMAQRFGRINRFGDRDDSRIDIVHPTKFDEKELGVRRLRTLQLLKQLKGNGSPAAFGDPLPQLAPDREPFPWPHNNASEVEKQAWRGGYAIHARRLREQRPSA
jgi:CRISPR-associated helicase Cas3